MTHTITRIVLLGSWCVGLLLSAPDASSSGWEDELSRLSMEAPELWSPMGDGLLARANAEVLSIAGRGHIGGYSFAPANTLVFPYMLIQYVDYGDRDNLDPLTHQLDDYAKLTLIREVTRSFRGSGALPEDIDLETFQNDFSSERAKLVNLKDGRFDITGKIPFEDNSGLIDYHAHSGNIVAQATETAARSATSSATGTL